MLAYPSKSIYYTSLVIRNSMVHCPPLILRHTTWLGTVGCPGIVRDGLGILGVRGYLDTVVGCPEIFRVGLGILGVRGYSDTLVGDNWMSRDCPGIVPVDLGILKYRTLLVGSSYMKTL